MTTKEQENKIEALVMLTRRARIGELANSVFLLQVPQHAGHSTVIEGTDIIISKRCGHGQSK